MKSSANSSPESLFQAVARHHGGVADAPNQRGFGTGALKVNGKIFASLSKGRLLLKLPRERVDVLIEAKLAERFSTGAGREKKEWVTIAPSHGGRWIALSDEARRYVMAQPKR